MISSFDAQTQLDHATVRLTVTTDPGHTLQAGDAEFAQTLIRAFIDHGAGNNGNGGSVVGEPARRR
jgi:hypothetical protein